MYISMEQKKAAWEPFPGGANYPYIDVVFDSAKEAPIEDIETLQVEVLEDVRNIEHWYRAMRDTLGIHAHSLLKSSWERIGGKTALLSPLQQLGTPAEQVSTLRACT